MREAGHLLALMFEQLKNLIEVGGNAKNVDRFIESFILLKGMVPRCKGYEGLKGPFPAASCISVNDVVVHGIPEDEVVFKDGDIVKVDVVASLKGLCVDMARSFLVGNVSQLALDLERVARESFYAALVVVRPGNFVSDISSAVQSYVEKNGFYVVREFVGHGIGRSMHEDPQIPNFMCVSAQVKLVPGMTLAIEPMILAARDKVVIEKDGWTARSSKGFLAAHYEDTVVVTADGCEVLTSCIN